jgi:hypothetical protein
MTISGDPLDPVVPPLPVASVLFAGVGSLCDAVAVARLSNAPAAVMVAVTVIVLLTPDARLAIVHGNAVQPPPLTPVIVRLVGVSVTLIVVAVEGPAFATRSV